MTTKITDELIILAMEVEAADRDLGVAIRRLNDSPLDKERQSAANAAKERFTTACIRYSDTKPD
jgi:hypothetical protein